MSGGSRRRLGFSTREARFGTRSGVRNGVLRRRFDRALEAILADGTYEKINAKCFPFSIY